MTSRSFHVAPLATLQSPVASPAARGSGGFFSSARSRSPSRSSLSARDEAKAATRAHRRRDPDVARMTAFPTPGQYAAPASPMQTPRSTGHMTTTTRQVARAKDAPRSATMYWMPDHLCKTCYDCGASFNVFRRRHHCRLCGQIFCHTCSSQFVDGTMHGFRHQMIRICKFCARYVSITTDAEKRQRLSHTNVSTRSGPSRRSSVDEPGALPAIAAAPAVVAAASSLPVASPLLFSAVDAAASEPLPVDDPMDFATDEFEEEVRAMVAAGDELLAAQNQEEEVHAKVLAAAAAEAVEEPLVSFRVPLARQASLPHAPPLVRSKSSSTSADFSTEPLTVTVEPSASPSPSTVPAREASMEMEMENEMETPTETPAPLMVQTSPLLTIQSSESRDFVTETQTPEPTVAKTFFTIQSSESVDFLTDNEVDTDSETVVKPPPLLTIQSSESSELPPVTETQTETPKPPTTEIQTEPPKPPPPLELTLIKASPLATIQSSESLDLSTITQIQTQTQTPPQSHTSKPTPSPESFRRPSLMRRRRSSLDFLNGDPTVVPPSTASTATDNESVASSSDTHTDDKPAPMLDHESESFRVRTEFHTQREIVLDKYMTAAHERIREGIQHSVDRSMKHFVGDPVEVKRLVTSLEDMAFIVTGHLLFSMNFRKPNGFNFAGLVKVKSIATPAPAPSGPSAAPPLSSGQDPYSFKWLAGCVCRKQLSHKQMARKIDNPRILLLACAISYDRTAGTNKLSSLDTLIDSEKSYMGILVDKISKLQPDIVFVEHTVSRPAQELLRERGIAIVLNVKHAMLERIARYTGATVLPSVDHVDQVVPDDVIGKCRSFYAQSVPVVVDDPLATPPNGEAQANAPSTTTTNGSGPSSTTNGSGPSSLNTNGSGITLQRMGSTRPKTETYLYLDGCDPLNGCTVLITGPSKKKLRAMKKLMRSVLMMTYRALLEAHVLSGLGLGFSDWYRRSLADHQDRAAWCTTCTLRQFETVDGELRYFQCSGSKQIGIAPYSDADISLGNFLAKEMNALGYRCHNPKCSFTMVDHVQTFNCTMGTITVSFEELPDAASGAAPSAGATDGQFFNVLSLLGNNHNSEPLADDDSAECPTIVYGKWCSECAAMICPFTPLKKYAYKFSLARLLEILLLDCYPQPPALEAIDASAVTAVACTHDFMKSHVLFFNVGRIVARMDFTPRKPLRLFNTPTFVVVNGRRRLCTSAMGVRSTPVSPSETVDPLGLAASQRAGMLSTVLDKVVTLFEDRIGSLQEVVLTCDDQDGGATDVLIEVALAKQQVADDYEAFARRLASIQTHEATTSQKRLAATDRAKRDLYDLVCQWIERTQQLRKMLRSTLAIEPDATSSVAASSFSLAGFGFSSPSTQSPVLSPTNAASGRQTRAESKGGRTPSAYAIDERSRASSAAQSFNSVSELNELFATSSPRAAAAPAAATAPSVVMPSPRVVKSTSAPVASSQFSTTASQFSTTSLTKSETKEAGWKSMLWDIYRAAGGKSSPGDDLELPLPVELFEGHSSLPHRSNVDDCVFLVSETEPITYVAYALASQSYDDQISAWKAAVQPAEAPPAEGEAAIELSSSSAEKEWTRAALTTSLHVHFKDQIVDTPRHLSLLYPSGSNTSGCWDFSTIAFFPLQFEALREMFYGSRADFLFSISHVNNWAALGGKSGASFYRTLDNRFVVKHISLTEQQSFLDVLPSYFDYMAKIYHDETPSVLSKTIGMYQTTLTRKDTGQRTTYHIVVMENAFYGHTISKTFDLKGSLRNRFVKPDADGKPRAVELDGNFVEMTEGHPMGVIAEDHELLLSAIMNDSAFLTSINIVDFSLVLGLGGETPDLPKAYTHMVVGIIDYMRQFDLMKRVESVSKSVAMIAGQSSPTIIEPALYSKRFSDALKRYFMPVTPIDSNRNDPYIPPSC